MDSDELSIPRIATRVQSSWRAENTAVTVAAAFERVKLFAKTLAVLVKLAMECGRTCGPRARRPSRTRSTSPSRPSSTVWLSAVPAPAPSPAASQRRRRGGAEPRRQRRADHHVRPARAGGRRRAARLVHPERGDLLAAHVGDPLAAQGHDWAAAAAAQSARRVRELVPAHVPDALTQGTSNDTSELYAGAWGNLMIGVRGLRARYQMLGIRDSSLGSGTGSCLHSADCQ